MTTATRHPAAVGKIIKAETEEKPRRGMLARLAAFAKAHPWVTAVLIAL